MADKAEILSEAEVDFLLQAMGDEVAPPPPPQECGSDQAVTMRGDLEQINLADIFQTLAMAKMEGVLRVRNPLEERQIHCRDGFVRVHVPRRLATRRLGQRLVRAGLIQVEQLRTALIEQGKAKKPIGQLLVEGGVITQEAIDEIVSTQIAEDLFSLFTWRHGSFEFWKGEPAAEHKRVFESCPEYEVGSLLLEVARRSDEWQSILEVIGNLDEVPVRVAEPPAKAKLEELHHELLPAVDGQTTYRELAERSVYTLFEVARAARDLARIGCIANVDDATMVAVATNHAALGQHRRALMVLQTLRDRPGDRALPVLQGMAQALERAGERKLAGSLLLEAAQRHTDAPSALELARSARALAPHDPTTLSFLRTVMLAHAPDSTAELEKLTLDLIDALIESDAVPAALEIIEDSRRTGTLQPTILLREVRARQRAHDVPGATRVLEELAHLYDERGERPQANDAYENLLRLDRGRKDVQKLLKVRRRTRLGRRIRIGAAVLIAGMLSTVGIVFWQQHQWAAAVGTANADITKLLELGDRVAARERLEHWTGVLGEGEAIDDLASRIAFAEATEALRQQKLLRERVTKDLTVAADHLKRGELTAAIAVYTELAALPRVAAEVNGIANARLEALLPAFTLAAKALTSRPTPEPSTLFDRRELERLQAELHSMCSPVLLRQFLELDELAATTGLPPFWAAEQHERVRNTLTAARAAFQRCKQLHTAYAEALQRNAEQRQLDPVFKAAADSERKHDFAKALELYRELERQPSNDSDLRAHFRDRVARNATIVRLLEATRVATAAGDHATAQQQLRALRLSFPEVPFDKLAQLPLRIDSRPPGATVRCNGVDVGTTPMVLPRLPADVLQLAVVAPGFSASELVVEGDDPGAWMAFLALPPDRAWRHGSAIEDAPVRIPRSLLLVDRAGNVSVRGDDGTEGWTFRSQDLSGLLTRPCVAGEQVLVGSLDGELRSLALATGALRWSLPDLPTEVAPALVGRTLVLATTKRRLHAVDVETRTQRTLAFPENVVALLPLSGERVAALGDGGRLWSIDLETMQPQWRRELTASSPHATVVAESIVVADDRGRVVAVSSANGDVRWQRDLDEEVLGAPAPAGRDVWITTRSALRRLDGASGAPRAAVAPSDEWTSAAVTFDNRLVAPLRSGAEVLDAASGTAMYRILSGRRARAFVLGEQLLITDADRVIQVFDRLR
jgi:tetratricopeptide (TPR) repeat protein